MKKQSKSFMSLKPEADLVPEDFMSQIPLWVVVSLGKHVMLKREFVGPVKTYPKGSIGILGAIDTDPHNSYSPYAIVCLETGDPSDLENFDFDDIEPVVSRIKYSLNLERGVIAF